MTSVRGSHEPKTGSLVPEIVLQSQFPSERASLSRLSGEYRLALAILQDAIQICWMARSGRRSLKLRREAACWLHSGDRSWCFSFERICEALELDADCVRRSLGSAGMPPAPALCGAERRKENET